MTPEMFLWISLIAKTGIEVAFKIFSEWRTKDEPTPEMWEALLKLSRKTMQDYIDETKPPSPPP